MAKHSVTIDDDVYTEIKEYCDLNGLKMNQLCNDILRDGIKFEKYGDILVRKVASPPVKEAVTIVHREPQETKIVKEEPAMEIEKTEITNIVKPRKRRL